MVFVRKHVLKMKKYLLWGISFLIAYNLGSCYGRYKTLEELESKSKLEEVVSDEYRKKN